MSTLFSLLLGVGIGIVLVIVSLIMHFRNDDDDY